MIFLSLLWGADSGPLTSPVVRSVRIQVGRQKRLLLDAAKEEAVQNRFIMWNTETLLRRLQGNASLTKRVAERLYNTGLYLSLDILLRSGFFELSFTVSNLCRVAYNKRNGRYKKWAYPYNQFISRFHFCFLLYFAVENSIFHSVPSIAFG